MTWVLVLCMEIVSTSQAQARSWDVCLPTNFYDTKKECASESLKLMHIAYCGGTFEEGELNGCSTYCVPSSSMTDFVKIRSFVRLYK